MAALTRADIVLKADGTGALQQLLGEYLPEECVLSPALNIWSKNKPINYPSDTELTTAQREGSDADKIAGYFWGVKVFNDGLSFSSLPTFTFDYKRPLGGSSSPYRLSDFIGYDHQAIPTLSGIMDSIAYRDVRNDFTVSISIDQSGRNTTGIDIVQLMSEKNVNLTNCYLFLAVGSYMAALKNRSTYDSITGNYEVTPIYYQNAWQTFFIADFNALYEEDSAALPLGDQQMTLFLVNYSYLSNIDYSGAWQQIGGIGEQAFTEEAYPVPFCAGKVISVQTFGNYPPDLTLSMPTTANNRGFTILYSFASTPSENVICEVSATISNSIPVTKTFTVGTGGDIMLWGFNWTDFGMISSPPTGTLIDLHVTVHYRYESGEHSKAIAGTSTMIVQNLQV